MLWLSSPAVRRHLSQGAVFSPFPRVPLAVRVHPLRNPPSVATDRGEYRDRHSISRRRSRGRSSARLRLGWRTWGRRRRRLSGPTDPVDQTTPSRSRAPLGSCCRIGRRVRDHTGTHLQQNWGACPAACCPGLVDCYIPLNVPTRRDPTAVVLWGVAARRLEIELADTELGGPRFISHSLHEGTLRSPGCPAGTGKVSVSSKARSTFPP